MGIKDDYRPYAMTTILLWSAAYVLTKLCLAHFSPFALGFWRYFIASLALAGAAALGRMRLPRWRDMPWFVLAGACGFFLYMIAFNTGQAQVSAATASVLIATVPMLTALMARLFMGERLTWVKWLAILMQFVGVAVLMLMEGTLSLNSGTLCLLGAALLLSGYNLIQRLLTRLYSPLEATTYCIFVGTLGLAVFLPDALRQAQSAPPIQWAYLAFLGLGSSALAYWCWAKAMQKAARTSQVSNFMFITPLLSALLGFVIAGEVPGKATWLGGGIILLGAVAFHLGGSARKGRRAVGG